MIYKYDVRNKKIAPTRIDFRFARIKFVTHIFLHAVSLKTSEQIKLIYNLLKLINVMTPNIVKQKNRFQSNHEACSTGAKLKLFELITYNLYYIITFYNKSFIFFTTHVNVIKK